MTLTSIAKKPYMYVIFQGVYPRSPPDPRMQHLRKPGYKEPSGLSTLDLQRRRGHRLIVAETLHLGVGIFLEHVLFDSTVYTIYVNGYT